jgi:hypothetical protein
MEVVSDVRRRIVKRLTFAASASLIVSLCPRVISRGKETVLPARAPQNR